MNKLLEPLLQKFDIFDIGFLFNIIVAVGIVFITSILMYKIFETVVYFLLIIISPFRVGQHVNFPNIPNRTYVIVKTGIFEVICKWIEDGERLHIPNKKFHLERKAKLKVRPCIGCAAKHKEKVKQLEEYIESLKTGSTCKDQCKE